MIAIFYPLSSILNHFETVFLAACYRRAYTVVCPCLSNVKTSYGSGFGPSMPGEPMGIPGTASPTIGGLSFNIRLMRSAGT
jgi:hypothetical protein